jgi:hypothetical protein
MLTQFEKARKFQTLHERQDNSWHILTCGIRLPDCKRIRKPALTFSMPPGLANKDDIVALVRSVDRPLNVVMGLQGVQMDIAELSEIGVRRISLGSSLARAAMGAFLRAARKVKEHGTFSFAAWRHLVIGKSARCLPPRIAKT